MVWADVGGHDVSLLDEVIVRVDDGERHGTVVITPDQMVNLPEPNGEIIAVRPRAAPDPGCGGLSGSHMPPLGSSVEIDGAGGLVVALDVPNGIVTVRVGDAERRVPVGDLEGPELDDP